LARHIRFQPKAEARRRGSFADAKPLFLLSGSATIALLVLIRYRNESPAGVSLSAPLRGPGGVSLLFSFAADRSSVPSVPRSYLAEAGTQLACIASCARADQVGLLFAADPGAGARLRRLAGGAAFGLCSPRGRRSVCLAEIAAPACCVAGAAGLFVL